MVSDAQRQEDRPVGAYRIGSRLLPLLLQTAWTEDSSGPAVRKPCALDRAAPLSWQRVRMVVSSPGQPTERVRPRVGRPREPGFLAQVICESLSQQRSFSGTGAVCTSTPFPTPSGLSGRVSVCMVGRSEVIQFDGLSPNRRSVPENGRCNLRSVGAGETVPGFLMPVHRTLSLIEARLVEAPSSALKQRSNRPRKPWPAT